MEKHTARSKTGRWAKKSQVAAESPKYLMLRISSEGKWGSPAKVEIVFQGTRQEWLERYPPTPEYPGMQLWLAVGTEGTTRCFRERYDCRWGTWEECGDPRFALEDSR
jgi:hypothetical protein